MENDDWMFNIPDMKDMGILDVVFGIPNEWTGGMFINMFLAGFFGTLYISSTYMQTRPDTRDAALYASTGTFTLTLIFTLVSTYTDATVAGENQLITVTVVLIGSIAWNYLSSEGGRI